MFVERECVRMRVSWAEGWRTTVSRPLAVYADVLRWSVGITCPASLRAGDRRGGERAERGRRLAAFGRAFVGGGNLQEHRLAEGAAEKIDADRQLRRNRADEQRRTFVTAH